MKLSILSESPADEAAVQIPVTGILGQPVQVVELRRPLRTRGWPSIKGVLPAVLKDLHYRTDVDALVLVVDSDNSPAMS